MIVATFNVNSARAHLQNILGWIGEFAPDVVLMQEIKCETQAFPALEFEDRGYNVKAFGQKSYNGVAIISKHSIEDIQCGIPGYGDPAARYMDALVGGRLRVANLYAPNGNPVGSEKFPYKLEWMKKLRGRLEELIKNDEEIIVGGDFNVIRRDDMVYDAKSMADDAVMRPESRAAFDALLAPGLFEAYDAIKPGAAEYTYWDYRAGAFAKDRGMVLDYFLLNEQARAKLLDVGVDKSPRACEHSSDHTPLWVELK